MKRAPAALRRGQAVWGRTRTTCSNFLADAHRHPSPPPGAGLERAPGGRGARATPILQGVNRVTMGRSPPWRRHSHVVSRITKVLDGGSFSSSCSVARRAGGKGY